MRKLRVNANRLTISLPTSPRFYVRTNVPIFGLLYAEIHAASRNLWVVCRAMQ